ncbi:sugar phosphate isomerase/epimerase family protein [Chitinophaga barathri]|uniref:Sugar phosphate isomerase/epimerase n=1 Tax=Chitinophaga barathri TaxID=1647451 RepID=A0A3N4MBU9_9BACT|nr:sugar phosphate isomerase/epimerase family protein [Chitinophaga barathri]RPD41354.1 sugar phosphate isomerase/epimerase [Chitinophaga barathri]
MKLSALFSLLFVSAVSFLQSNAQEVKLPQIGVATSFDNDSLLSSAGFVYIEESARKLLAPGVEDSTYRRQLASLKAMKLEVRSCNLFLPGTIRLFGPGADEKQILGYVDTLMFRAREAGIKLIVFGSAGSRKLLDGMDPQVSLKELIAISRKMAEVAAKYDRIIAIENLNKSEDNFINSLEIVTEIVKAVNHPNFRITADIYHMKKEGEDPERIVKAAPWLVHCHIAEKEGRRAPGTLPEDFTPYLAALKRANFKGRITMECSWKNIAEECKPALVYLQKQLAEAYK